jgi:hypothetical protein
MAILMAKQGADAMVEALTLKNGRVGFPIDDAPAARSHLAISAHLLKVAPSVRSRDRLS